MTMKSNIYLLLFFSLFSCQKEDQTAALQLEEDIVIIEEYLADQGLVAQRTASGLHYIIQDPGSGTSYPTSQSKVTVAYVGSLPDGTIFEESIGGNPPTFYLYQVIKGWQEGIPKFRKGGKGKLLIPSGLAYGSNSPSEKVPPNAVLIFDIQLVNIQ